MRRLLKALREPGRLKNAAKGTLPYLWIELVLPGGSLLFAYMFLRRLQSPRSD